jgi:transposase-like protein
MAPTPRSKAGPRARGELAEYYEELLAEQEESGLSVTAFAEQVGLSAATLYSWRRKLSGDDEEDDGSTGRLVQVAMARSSAGTRRAGVLVLRVGEEFEVELDEDFDAEALRRLLAILDEC